MIRFRVANTVFEITTDIDREIVLDRAYDDFLCNDQPDIRLSVYYRRQPHLKISAKGMIFDSEGSWKLYHLQGKKVITTSTPILGPEPYRTAIFNDSFTEGEIFVNIPNLDISAATKLPDPFEFPLSEILMLSYLAQQHGIMVHACGVGDKDRGYLFTGNSTHGKSTTARLWQKHARVLNDDRIIIREENGVLKMFGTPWHGAFPGVAAMSIPLHKIFFLRHADKNQIVAKSGVTAASMLFTRCFPPFWDQEGIEYTLKFCEKIVTSVPCYELGFVPDEKVVEFVRCAP